MSNSIQTYVAHDFRIHCIYCNRDDAKAYLIFNEYKKEIETVLFCSGSCGNTEVIGRESLTIRFGY